MRRATRLFREADERSTTGKEELLSVLSSGSISRRKRARAIADAATSLNCANAATTMVHVRVDESTKNQATETLVSMGLTVSDAVRVFLTRVVADQELPFALQAPNASARGDARGARHRQGAFRVDGCIDP